MKFSWTVFGHLAQVIGPLVISTLNPKLAPLAGAISGGIAEAEQIPEATGPEKLQHVINIADQTVSAVNASAGKVVVDPIGLHEAATEAIDTTVAIIKLAHPVALANVTAASSTK